MKKAATILVFFLFFSAFAPLSVVAETVTRGKTKTVVSKTFLKLLHHGMPMQDVEGLLGAPGRLINNDEGIETYRWRAPSSGITVNFKDNKLVDAIVMSDGRYHGMDVPMLGTSEECFDRPFLEKVKTCLDLERLESVIGAPGMKVSEVGGTVPSESFHWEGKRGSSLTVTVAAGKIVDAKVVSEKGETYSLKRDQLTAVKN